MKLRYPGVCRECGARLPPGTDAIYDRAARNVICLDCASAATVVPSAAEPADGSVAPPGPVAEGASAPIDAGRAAAPIDAGRAGASAQREYQRRAANRERRIRERHPKLGGLILALSDEPQSTTAWQHGAAGEELLGRRLDGLQERGVRLLHDRRIPGSRANIDHIAVSPAGVFVLDAKRYRGRPNLRVQGGMLRPRTETLMVGTRKCDPLVQGMRKQLDLVGNVLAGVGLKVVPLHGMLVFIGADWPMFGGEFTTRGVRVLWPRKAAEHITGPGHLTPHGIDYVHRLLAARFPLA